MADKVTFDLVTPDKLLVSGEFEMVVVPGAEGDFGVLAGHAPIVSSLRPGALDIYEGDTQTERYFIAGGLAEMDGTRLTVLAEEAIPVAELKADDMALRVKNAEEDVNDATDEDVRARAQERLDHLRDIQQVLMS
jgi:F-type H+-transporting ATPase subunit epsilon